jgi:hypothetical protein
MNDEKSTAPVDSVAAVTDSVAVRVTETGIRRLNAEDGLYLRAEHLRQMQQYARDIALLAGVAAGPGVDYGFNVTLAGSAIHVTPGLAIDAARCPLRSLRDVTVSLDGLDTTGAKPVLDRRGRGRRAGTVRRRAGLRVAVRRPVRRGVDPAVAGRVGDRSSRTRHHARARRGAAGVEAKHAGIAVLRA